ncbi:MAG: glycosyltransferase family A protein, partial [Cumulibacter sp.]
MYEADSVTVCVLTFNGDKYLKRVLDGIEAQVYNGPVEVLVIDSGSTDRTLAIVEDYPEVRLHQIANSDFQHGRTRNLAAELSSTEFIAYLTQDAIPANEWWLHELTEPFRRFPDVVGVMGKQIPRANCYPMLKREIRQVFSQMGPDFGTSIFYRDSALPEGMINSAANFYSDVNSAARLETLRQRIRYREVPYAEDQLFGADVLEAGLAKAYASRAVVEHSNDLDMSELRGRTFDETVGLRRIGLSGEPPSPAEISKLIRRDTLY